MDDPASRVNVAALGSDARATFVKRTYAHVFGSMMAFTLIEVILFQLGIAERIAAPLMRVPLLLVGGFLLVGWLASRTAHRAVTSGAQYTALSVYVLAEAIIFVPLLLIANAYAPGAISSAALVTLVGFTGLTALVVYSKKDFVFLGSLLKWGFIVALLAIVGGVVFGFNLGLGFSVAMVALAGAAILYDTSNILYRYPEDRYVAAALELFASVALMFWYVLRIFLASRR